MKDFMKQFYRIGMLAISGFGLLTLVVAFISGMLVDQTEFLKWSLMSILMSPLVVIALFIEVIALIHHERGSSSILKLTSNAPPWMKKGVIVCSVVFVVFLVTSVILGNEVYVLIGGLLFINYLSLAIHWSKLVQK